MQSGVVRACSPHAERNYTGNSFPGSSKADSNEISRPNSNPFKNLPRALNSEACFAPWRCLPKADVDFEAFPVSVECRKAKSAGIANQPGAQASSDLTER